MSKPGHIREYDSLKEAARSVLEWCSRFNSRADLTKAESDANRSLQVYVLTSLRAAMAGRISAPEMIRRQRKFEAACLKLHNLHSQRRLGR